SRWTRWRSRAAAPSLEWISLRLGPATKEGRSIAGPAARVSSGEKPSSWPAFRIPPNTWRPPPFRRRPGKVEAWGGRAVRESLHVVASGTFGGFRDVQHLIEVSFLTATDEAFGVAFEFVPALADFFRLLGADGMVDGRVGDLLEKGGELADDFVGRGQDLETFLAATLGIADEVAAVLLA